MRASVYDQQGKEAGTIILPEAIFDVKMNFDLLFQVAVSQMANQRQVIAQTKDRSEVRGGGRKPWRQKGTGRARHGSIRSPLWRGGGVTFGPRKEKKYKKIIPKKMKRKALFMVLSSKVKDNELIVVDELKLEKPKTKEFLGRLKAILKEKKGSILVTLPKKNENILKAARNIPGIKVLECRNLNILDLLNYKFLVMPKESIKTIEETFRK